MHSGGGRTSNFQRRKLRGQRSHRRKTRAKTRAISLLCNNATRSRRTCTEARDQPDSANLDLGIQQLVPETPHRKLGNQKTVVTSRPSFPARTRPCAGGGVHHLIGDHPGSLGIDHCRARGNFFQSRAPTPVSSHVCIVDGPILGRSIRESCGQFIS